MRDDESGGAEGDEARQAKAAQDEGDSPRRDFFRSAVAAAGVIGVAGALHGKYGSAPIISSAQAQTPPGGAQRQWWPSRWGINDEAGASNWITPEKVLDATKWIREGRIFRIGRAWSAGYRRQRQAGPGHHADSLPG